MRNQPSKNIKQLFDRFTIASLCVTSRDCVTSVESLSSGSGGGTPAVLSGNGSQALAKEVPRLKAAEAVSMPSQVVCRLKELGFSLTAMSNNIEHRKHPKTASTKNPKHRL